MIAMCCQLPSTTMSATITSADANPSPSATQARSSNQVGATSNDYTTEVGPRIRTMEPLWSPVVATRGNPRQIGLLPERLKQAKTVAASCVTGAAVAQQSHRRSHVLKSGGHHEGATGAAGMTVSG